MIKTLLEGVTEKDMQAVVNTYNVQELYYPTLFPPKENFSLTIKALEATTGLRIAGDIIARGASGDAKSRDAISKIQGDIPKVFIKRYMDDNELDAYQTYIGLANTDQARLVELWADDTKFCFDGVNNRIEWIALRSISTGKVTLTLENNGQIVTEYDLDYQVPADQKYGYQVAAWSDVDTAAPITRDFKKVVEDARKKGINLKHAFMNLDTFAKLSATKEVIKLCASYAANVIDLPYIPSVEQVNKTLKQLPYLRGLQIHVIDQDITIETPDGARTTANPFADDAVTFTEAAVLGNTYWKMPADMKVTGSSAIKAMNGLTLVKKFAEEEPLKEVTIGLANALPTWQGANRAVLFDCGHSSFNIN